MGSAFAAGCTVTSELAATGGDASANPTMDGYPWAVQIFSALISCLLVFCVAALWQAIYLPQPAQSWTGPTFTVATAQLVAERGTLSAMPGGLVKITPDNGAASVRLSVSIDALEETPMVWWSMRRADVNTNARLVWQANQTTYAQPIEFSGNDVVDELRFIRDPRWLGPTNNLSLQIVGTAPVVFAAPKFRADSVMARLGLMADGWFGFQRWKMADLNFIEVADTSKTYYFNLTLNVALVVVLMGAVLNAFWREEALHLNTVLCIVFAAWLIGALRWQWDLGQKTWDSWKRFGGKTLHEKHLAADDHEFYWVIENLRPLLKLDNTFATPFYVLHVPDEKYDAGKLRYYATPFPVRTFYVRPPAGAVFGVLNFPYRFDAKQGIFSFGANITFPAEKLGQREGAAIFRAK